MLKIPELWTVHVYHEGTVVAAAAEASVAAAAD